MNRPPRISFVSLGCPKALVDSERIITRLRAEGYELSRDHADADLAIVNTCGFLDSAQAESLAAIGAALAENGKVVVTGCMGAEPEKITAVHPERAGDHRPAAIRERARRGPSRRSAAARSRIPISFRRRASSSRRATTLISRFQRVATIVAPSASSPSCAAIWSRGRPPTCCARPSGWSPRGQGAARHFPGYIGLRRRLKYAASEWKGREVRAKFVDLARALGELGVWVRLHYVYPYPHVDEVIPLMADGKVLPYLDVPFQHASPAVLKRMRRPAAQEKTLERIRRGARSAPASRCARPSSSAFPARPRRIFRCCSTGSARPSSIASAASATSRSPAPPPTISPRRCPRRSRGALDHRLMQRQQAISRKAPQAQGRRPRARHHR
jgi:ribosomal protein S12 methylthiotransferase